MHGATIRILNVIFIAVLRANSYLALSVTHLRDPPVDTV